MRAAAAQVESLDILLKHRHGRRLGHTQDRSRIGRPGHLRRIADGQDDIFPDPLSQELADGWRTGVAKALEHQMTALLDAAPAAV